MRNKFLSIALVGLIGLQASSLAVADDNICGGNVGGIAYINISNNSPYPLLLVSISSKSKDKIKILDGFNEQFSYCSPDGTCRQTQGLVPGAAGKFYACPKDSAYNQEADGVITFAPYQEKTAGQTVGVTFGLLSNGFSCSSSDTSAMGCQSQVDSTANLHCSCTYS